MADNDYHIIKPVDGTQNITALPPIKRRQERRRRQNSARPENHRPDFANDQPEGDRPCRQSDDQADHGIDYRA